MDKYVPPPPYPRTSWAYFLDFDGTLVEIADTPDAIRVDDALRRSLARLSAATNGALAVVSGRPIAELDRHLAPLRLPLAGLHGLETRATGEAAVTRFDVDTAVLDTARRHAATVARRYKGILVEDKISAIAVHYRNIPDAAADVRQAMQAAVSEAAGALSLLDGKMVVEVKPHAVCKGGALERLSEAVPFAGRRPCFIGDDVTDEDGFRACNARDGISIHVGDGTATTLAGHMLADPEAVRVWLDQAIDAQPEAAP